MSGISEVPGESVTFRGVAKKQAVKGSKSSVTETFMASIQFSIVVSWMRKLASWMRKLATID